MPKDRKPAGGAGTTGQAKPARPRAPGRKTGQYRALPGPQAVLSETVLVTPKGTRYRVIRTREMDAYDPPAGKDPPAT